MVRCFWPVAAHGWALAEATCTCRRQPIVGCFLACGRPPRSVVANGWILA